VLNFRSNIQAGQLWVTNQPVEPRYPTEEPHEFLCKNDGKYSPWWGEEKWDRCGNAIDADELEERVFNIFFIIKF